MDKKALNRRDFLRKASLGVIGGYVTLKSAPALAQRMGGGGGGGGGMGGGGGVIDPPPGAAFKDPLVMTNISTIPGEVEVNLDVRRAPININGVMANLFTYNGSYPGPTIRIKKGDTLKINFSNSLQNTTQTNMLGFQKNLTNLHTHGMHVSPKEPADAAHLEILPGLDYHYQYETSLQEAGTLNFYHSHKHGLVAEQHWGGLAGALVVEDEDTTLTAFETHILVLKDISLSGNDPAPYTMMSDYMHGKEGNTIMVNGQVNPVLSIRPGQVQRWRILNASNARFYKLSLAGHTMHLIGSDGGLLDKAYARSQILLSPGERVDVLVKASTTKGNYKFQSLSYSRMGMMSSAQITLMTMAVTGSRTNDAIPGAVNPNAIRLNPNSLPIAAQRTLALSMGQGRGYINSQDFDVNPYTIMSEVGTYEIWTVTNQTNMDHPFHQHVNSAQVLSISAIDSSYPSYATMPAWKDVVLIPKGGSAKLLVPVMDYDGMTMFHCHILEHEDIGMMGMWHIMGMPM